MNSCTTPVTASSFPKWKSNKQRHIIEKSTGREFYFEQDPLSLKWHDITPLKTKETDTNGDERNTSPNEPVSRPEIPKKSKRKVKKKKKLVCETSAGSMVDIMSLVKKHLNKSKTSVVNRNDLNCELDGAESLRKNIKTENGIKSKHKPSISTSTSESINIKFKPLQHDHVKIKLDPSSYCAGQSNQESSYNTEENQQEPSGLYARENVQEFSGHFAKAFDQELTDFYAGENGPEASGQIVRGNEQEQTETWPMNVKQEPSNYIIEGSKEEFHNANFDTITENHSNVGTVKIKKESSGYGIVKIKKEPLDFVELIQSAMSQPVSNFHGSYVTQSTDVTRLKTQNSLKQSRPNESLDEKDILKNSNTSFAVKLELTKIDDIYSFENESSVCLNSPSRTSNNSPKKEMSDSDNPSDKTVRTALEFKYQCFSAEPKSKLIKQPDPNVLYNKTKKCRHSNRFQNGESIECGCVRQNYLKCDICGLVLTTSSYTRHVQTHYKIRRFKCPKCTKIYKCTFQFDKHYNQCLKQTKFQCFKCLEVFKRFSFLKSHMVSCTVN